MMSITAAFIGCVQEFTTVLRIISISFLTVHLFSLHDLLPILFVDMFLCDRSDRTIFLHL